MRPLAVFVLLAAPAVAAPVPRGAAPPVEFRDGQKLVYAVTAGPPGAAIELEMTITTTRVRGTPAGDLFRLDTALGSAKEGVKVDPPPPTYHLVTRTKAVRADADGKPLHDPDGGADPAALGRMKPGDTLRTPAKDGEKVGECVFTAEAEETVEVPAGKYRATRIRLVQTMKGDPAILSKLWYAVGTATMVKAEATIDGAAASVMTLKAHTPGK